MSVRSFRKLGCAGSLILAACLFTPRARAQQTEPPVPTEPESARAGNRQLGHHTFPVLAFVPSSFVTTHFTLRQGVLRLSVSDFPLNIDDQLDVSMIGLNETLELGFQTFDSLELFGVVGGQVLTGVEFESILTLGTSFSYHGGGGAAFRFLRTKGTQLTVRGRLVFDSGGSLDLIRLIDELNMDDRTLEELFEDEVGQVVLEDTSRREFLGHLLFAQSLGRNVGIQAAAGVSQTSYTITAWDVDAREDIETDTSNWAPEASAGLDVNLLPIAPMTFALEYALRGRQDITTINDDDIPLSHIAGLGVHLVHDSFDVSLTAAQALNLQPVKRTALDGTELESDEPTMSYFQLGLHMNW
jgi:hypothetical protein